MCCLQVISFSVFTFYPLMLCFLLARTLFLAAEFLQRNRQQHQQRLQGHTCRAMYLGGGLLWDKEGRKEVIMETHVCVQFMTFFLIILLGKAQICRTAFVRRIQTSSRPPTCTQVLYIPVLLPSMFLEVLWVLEGTNRYIFRVVSLEGLARLG